MRIDVTAELGAGLGESSYESESQLWPLVGTALIPCGAHTGDPVSILRACGQAVAEDRTIGASVGYADRLGAGERFIDYDADDLAATIIYQLGALAGLARSEQAEIRCIRPAGALFEASRTDRNQAWAVVNAVLDFDPSLRVIGLPESRLLKTAQRHGLAVSKEFQPHRLLNANGSLGAVITDPRQVVNRAVKAAAGGEYDCLRLPQESPDERATAALVHAALVEAGYQIAHPLAASTPDSVSIAQ